MMVSSPLDRKPCCQYRIPTSGTERVMGPIGGGSCFRVGGQVGKIKGKGYEAAPACSVENFLHIVF